MNPEHNTGTSGQWCILSKSIDVLYVCRKEGGLFFEAQVMYANELIIEI